MAERRERAEGSLLRSSATVAAGTLLSRLSGAARDVLLAMCVPSRVTDMFFVAFTIPNTLRSLLGEGASSAAFVPILTDARRNREQQGRILRSMMGTMGVVLMALSALGVLIAPWLVVAYAPGFDAATQKTTAKLLRWLFPYLFLMGMAALLTSALHVQRRFFLAALAPISLNVGLVAATVAWTRGLTPSAGPTVLLAWGALAGGVLHVLVLAVTLLRTGHRLMPRWHPADAQLRHIVHRLTPLLAGVGVYQAFILAARALASFLEPGTQSQLYYAQRLVEIPQGMLALSVATASLPSLAQLFADEQHARAREALSRALQLTTFFAAPCAWFLFTFAEPVVTLLFQSDTFTDRDLHRTASALRLQALGIWPMALSRTLIPMFHARGRTQEPVVASALAFVTFLTTASLLLRAWDVRAIALAFSLGALTQLLWLTLRVRRDGSLDPAPWMRSSLRAGGATVLCMIAGQGVLWSVGPSRWAALPVAVACALTYLVTQRCFGAPELSWFPRRHRKP